MQFFSSVSPMHKLFVILIVWLFKFISGKFIILPLFGLIFSIPSITLLHKGGSGGVASLPGFPLMPCSILITVTSILLSVT